MGRRTTSASLHCPGGYLFWRKQIWFAKGALRLSARILDCGLKLVCSGYVQEKLLP
jgi:hypothetical protein